jgi:hypothetical protein
MRGMGGKMEGRASATVAPLICLALIAVDKHSTGAVNDVFLQRRTSDFCVEIAMPMKHPSRRAKGQP